MAEVVKDDLTIAQEKAKDLGIELSGQETLSEVLALVEAVGQMQPDEKSDLIEVITTAVGATPTLGLVAIGSRMSVPVGQFSVNWMKPADSRAAKAVKAELSKRASGQGAE